MKTRAVLSSCLAAAALMPLCTAPSAHAEGLEHALAGALRYHQDFQVEEFNFGEGDLSFLLAYELHEKNAFWQIGVGYLGELSAASNTTDYVLTPQINLIFKDRYYRIGAGALWSYVVDEDSEKNWWTDAYWQVLMGVQIPLGDVIRAEVAAYYVFNEWETFTDEFDFDVIEYAFWLRYVFR